jgi:hypothetical protein
MGISLRLSLAQILVPNLSGEHTGIIQALFNRQMPDFIPVYAVINRKARVLTITTIRIHNPINLKHQKVSPLQKSEGIRLECFLMHTFSLNHRKNIPKLPTMNKVMQIHHRQPTYTDRI